MWAWITWIVIQNLMNHTPILESTEAEMLSGARELLGCALLCPDRAMIDVSINDMVSETQSNYLAWMKIPFGDENGFFLCFFASSIIMPSAWPPGRIALA